ITTSIITSPTSQNTSQHPNTPPLTPSTLFSLTHTPTTKNYTLSLHDALPILIGTLREGATAEERAPLDEKEKEAQQFLKELGRRSEEHTSELQSRGHLVCRLLLEKKKK